MYFKVIVILIEDHQYVIHFYTFLLTYINLVIYQGLTQGSINLIFVWTNFCPRVHKTVMVGTNLHCLIYNSLIAIVFPTYFAIS